MIAYAIITDAPDDVSPVLWTHVKQVYNIDG